jgi:HEAT repeat protein
MTVFLSTVAILSAGSSLLLAVLVWERIRLRERERRRTRTERLIRPAVLAFVDENRPLPIEADKRLREAVVDVLTGYGRLLRGPARERVAAYLEEAGVVRDEIHALRHRAAWRRMAAAYRLGDTFSRAATKPLLGALDDTDREVRAVAARSVGRLGSPEAVEPLLASLVDRRIPEAIARWSLLQIGEAALPPLRRLVAHDEPAERAGALQLIGLLGAPTDSELAVARLRDSSATVREQAALALGRIGGDAAIPALLETLDDRVPGVRGAAAVALGRLRDARAVPSLLRQAQRDIFEPARAAAHAVVQIDAGLVAGTDLSDQPYLREAADLALLR